jgi:Protein of unknown function (DUF1524)
MRRAQARVFLLAIALLCGALTPVASASTLQLVVAEDKTTGYNRSLFKHWIDADKDGCNTRAEVLIEEAVVKPKIGPRCKLTGGKWLSSYDGKTITNASQLDVDHLVPLAEAWRSGAWKWTAEQRQAFANDLDNSEALIAVTLSTNRSKGDKDPSDWLPKIGRADVCEYIKDWIDVKWKYSLTVDARESNKLQSRLLTCFGNAETRWLNEIPKVIQIETLKNLPSLPVPNQPLISYTENNASSNRYQTISVSVDLFSGFEKDKMELVLGDINWKSPAYDDGLICTYIWSEGRISNVQKNIPSIPISFSCDVFRDRKYELALIVKLKPESFGQFSNFSTQGKAANFLIPKVTVTTEPTPISAQPSTPTVSPGAFCSPAGAIGKSTSGVTYTCKTSPTDTRNRWRQ